MTYRTWESDVPSAITADPVWKQKAYRLALFASDVGWPDVTKLLGDRRTMALSDQLYRSIGSISANICEGYSRSSGLDRVRFYEYALGSSREARDWYHKSRHVLRAEVVAHRLDLHAQIIRLLLAAIPLERKRMIRESPNEYAARPPSETDVVTDERADAAFEVWAQQDVPFAE
jgi:four helix bundle protein